MIIINILFLLLFFLYYFISKKNKRNNIILIKSDGNCFFRAISAALNNGDQEKHYHYRNILYKSFLKYPIKSEFMSDLELKFIKNLKYNGTWIDSQLAIYRLSDILERDILFIGFGKNYNRKKFKKKKPIYLLWYKNIHYDLYDTVKDSVFNNKFKINL